MKRARPEASDASNIPPRTRSADGSPGCCCADALSNSSMAAPSVGMRMRETPVGVIAIRTSRSGGFALGVSTLGGGQRLRGAGRLGILLGEQVERLAGLSGFAHQPHRARKLHQGGGGVRR